ncbi:MAG: hypothetical protein ACR2JN_07670 [Lapillicoccus sp.]
MSRVFWLGVAATVGVLGARRVARAVNEHAPSGATDNLAALREGLRDLTRTVRGGIAEREEELRHALGLDTHTLARGGMDTVSARRLLDDPTGPRARQG